MAEPIFATKLFLPCSHSTLVPRPHLIEKLESGLECKLSLLSAPAGFGKTTTLCNWIEQSSLLFGWLSIDKDDNDPLRFFIYLIRALQTVDSNLGEPLLPALSSPQPPAVETLVPYLVDEISGGGEIALVLDDYHLITNQVIQDAVLRLIQYIPANLHLVISTRTDPPFPLSRMRICNELNEIRAADLRFSLNEADKFLNQIMQLDISEKDVEILNRRTEGWVTGLQMALLSLQSYQDKGHFIQSFNGSNRYVIDYLMEEVLNHQPEKLRSFLLKTSILKEFCGGICCEITGESDSQTMLEEMERKNLFLISLDDHREWYRYHHLFADLLKKRLLQNDPGVLSDLHRRASAWYESHNMLGYAIEHARNAQDFDTIIRLLENYINFVWEFGDQVKLSDWLTALPQEVIFKHPVILAHYAFTLCFSGRYEEAENQLRMIEASDYPLTDEFLGMAATVRAHIALYSNHIEKAEEYSTISLEKLPTGRHVWRSLALSIRGDVQAFHGYVLISEQVWSMALEQAEQAGCVFIALMITAKLIVARKRLGLLRSAEETFQKQTRRVSKGGHSQLATAGALYAVFGDVLLEWNRVEDAEEKMHRGLYLSERQEYMAGVAWSMLSLIKLNFIKGDYDAAEEIGRDLEARFGKHKMPYWTLNWLTAWKVRIAIRHAEYKKAEDWLNERGIKLDGAFGYPSEVEYLAYIRLLIAKASADQSPKTLAEAQTLLNRLRKQLEGMGWVDKIHEAQVLQICIYQMQGQDEKALQLLRSTLEDTESERYMRVYLDEGDSLSPLLYKILETEPDFKYPAEILAAMPEALETLSKQKKKPDLVEPLSRRELEVLRLVEQGATNQEICLKLHIAVGTVKNHLKNIYGKLNVHNRTQAAARTRALGLFD